ncbi:uncharacterized protein LOC111347493 [Stylophora pistillata]|uniref:uncharacterized protein LOC111347493 n=1 Tax=Stylophora pistillata TaxID=50429 RepID=UPI000C052242|nr:uncharacterized protein LOC111347493 [Stylophora pistillata]
MATGHEKEVSLFDLASEKIADAQKLMAEAKDLLKQDLDNARQEKAAIEEITKTLRQIHFSSKIKLNVGGKIYKTTLDTLRKDPDSMLCAMFSGKFELKADEEDGAYFIDRDGKLFRYILNYLRDGDFLYPEDQTVREQLLKEAKFYQVQGIVLCGSRYDLFSVLIIKDKNHESTLLSWLSPGVTFSLLYCASADGNTPADFHRCCDNNGPTLVMIRSEDCICGGYTSKSWVSASPMRAIEDDESFLFTLINPSGSKPMRIYVDPDNPGGIQCDRDKGPCFGTSKNYDLQVWYTFNATSPKESLSRFDMGYGFSCPESVNKRTFFTGKYPFKITELEVFKVKF